jgi:hypothetical protein
MAAPLTLLGGPLHQLGRTLGLVRHETNTVLLGIALGWGLWLLIVVVMMVEGIADRFFAMSVVGGHARLLLVIPLFFIAESWVAPRMAAFVTTITRNGVVPPGEAPALDAEVSRTCRWANWWWPEGICLLLAIQMQVGGLRLLTYGETGGSDAARTSLSFFVYLHGGLVTFRFLLFRWAWKLGLWGRFLWRVSRLNLQPIPGHPDRAGGLGSLEGVHERFTPLVAALSVVECASLAESISVGMLAATAVYPTIALLLLLDGALFIGPLLVFTDKLWIGRTKGVGLYMRLAARYVTEFEAKWTGDRMPAEPLLGNADFQSMADLANAVNVVKGMRWITVGPRLMTMMTLAAVVPLTPLVLFQYPIDELARKFFARLVGL